MYVHTYTLYILHTIITLNGLNEQHRSWEKQLYGQQGWSAVVDNKNTMGIYNTIILFATQSNVWTYCSILGTIVLINVRPLISIIYFFVIIHYFNTDILGTYVPIYWKFNQNEIMCRQFV